MTAFYVGQTDYITQLNVLSSSMVLPTVAGNSGKYLITDGTNTSWAAIPTATNLVLGLVKVDGTTITINNGVISGTPAYSYSLPIATTTVLGGVKVDNTTITINNGVISAPYAYTLPISSTSVLGGVKVDGTTISINSGVISYILPVASTSVLGGVKVDGSTLTYNASGQLYYTGLPAGGIPVASTSVLGGVKVDGTTITINNGVISGFNGLFSSLSSTPTTLLGYGITDTLTTIGINTAIAVETTRATTAEALLAPKASPTFTGTVSGITKTMVGLNNVDNTTDLNKPVSTATTAAIGVEVTRATTAEALLAPIASPTFTGIVSGLTKTMVGLANVDNTSDINKPVSTAITTAIAVETTRAIGAEALLAPIASPIFTGIVSGITKTMVGLANVDNTTDLNKPVSTLTAAAIAVEVARATGAEAAENTRALAAEALLAPRASPTFTGTVSGITKTMVGLPNVDNTSDLNKPVSTATTAAIAVETSRALAAEALLAPQITTYTKTETDARIQSIVGAAPVALDTLSEIATQLLSDESVASVLTNTVSLKAPIASPTFTGTVSGITKTMVGLDSVDNTSDLNKAVSTATTAAIAVETSRAIAAEAAETSRALAAEGLKAPIASPTFTGTVTGITKAMVGLGNVDNTTDLSKPVSTATTAAIAVETSRALVAEALLSPIASPIFTGTVTIPTGASIAGYAPLASPTFTGTVTLPSGTIIPGFATINSPTFTGNVGGITKAMVGLDSVSNTTDLDKPVSTATTNALDLRAPKISPTFTGITTAAAFQEYFTTPTIVSNAVTLNYSLSGIFYFPSVSEAFTANFTNIPTTAGYISTATLIIQQEATAYLPLSSITINTAPFTIKWQGAVAAIGVVNRFNLVTLSFIQTTPSTWTVIGALTSYA